MMPVLNSALMAVAFLSFCYGMAPRSNSVPERKRRNTGFVVATVLVFAGLSVNI